jgi:alpha-N-acetylglucosamine transferase
LFAGTYGFSKIKIFELTEYKRLVYLDTDIIVRDSLQELFDCAKIAKFCAVVRLPPYFNGGIISFVPSEKTYRELFELSQSTTTLEGSDQGLLNFKFDKLYSSPLYSPHLSKEKEYDTLRLDIKFNGDFGHCFIQDGNWQFLGYDPVIIHYTLSVAKPW